MAKYLGLGTDGSVINVACGATGGTPDAGKIPELDSNGKLYTAMLPDGVGVDTITVPASVALSVGDFVNLWDDAGVTKARKADNTSTTTKANGFVKSAVASGANAVVYLEGSNDVLTGLTIGTKYYLGVTGGFTTTIPTTTNSIIQLLGTVRNATTLRFEQNDYIKNA